MNAKSRAIGLLRSFDDWIFERLGRHRILFVMTDGYGFACQAPVIRALLEDGRAVVRVVDHDNRREHSFATDDDKKLFAALRIDARLASIRKWHQVVYSHLCSFYPKRHALLAYMHHGPGFGSGGGHLAVERCDLYFGLSESEFSYLDDRIPRVLGVSKAFFPVGFPKVDSLVAGAVDRNRALQSLGLPNQKTLLIASKWNPGSLLRDLEARPFEMLAQAFPQWNVIQNGHPWLWQRRNDIDPEWQDKLATSLRAVEQRYPNARFLPDIPAEHLAVIADLLVADRTSVVTTFALLNRPIVLFDNPALPTGAKQAGLTYLEAAHVFQSQETLVDVCQAAMDDPGAREAGRNKLRKMFYANPGTAAQEMARILHGIGRVCSTRSSRWPRVMESSQRARLS